MRAGEEPGPVDEGGDPACWAHLFDEDVEPAGEDGPDDEGTPDP